MDARSWSKAFLTDSSQELNKEFNMGVNIVKLVFLSPIELYPPTKGASLRVLTMGRYLSRMGHKVIVICPVNPLVIWKLRSTKFQLEENFMIVFRHFLNVMVLKELLSADMVQFEYPYLLPYMVLLKILQRPFVLDSHGIESTFIRELKKLPEIPRKKTIGFILQKIPGLRPVVLAIEKLALRISPIVLACSKSDSLEMQRMYNIDRTKIIVVPNCADPSFFKSDFVPHRFRRPTVLFMGSYNYPPNVHGALLLVKHIMPVVRETLKDVLFVFVGRNPPPELVNEKSDNILFTGEVNDVRPFIMGADVVVAPIFYGYGTKQKVIEYMALGRPIVSTSKGMEGIEAEEDVHFLRRDTLAGFSEAVIQLLKDRQRAELMGRRSREIAKQKYAWETQIANVVLAHKRLMQKTRKFADKR